MLESFDFGLLAVGYDLEDNSLRDMRDYLFPGLDPNGPLPMMPNKRSNWRNGFISQYNGLRECGRYAKYHGYGLRPEHGQGRPGPPGTGLRPATCRTTSTRTSSMLGKIYEAIAVHIETDNIVELTAASKEIDYKDSLDVIMEALE